MVLYTARLFSVKTQAVTNYHGAIVPWRNPENWLSAEVMAPVLSFVLALFRTMYQDKEPNWMRRIIESAMCGMITLSASYGIDAMGLNGDWKYVAAGSIGFLGADYIRGVAHKFINKKVGDK